MPPRLAPTSTTCWTALPSAIAYTTLPAGRSTTLCSGTSTASSRRAITTAAFTVPPGRRPSVFSMSTMTSRARPVSDTLGLISLTLPRNSLPGSCGEVRITAWPFCSRIAVDSGKGRWARSLRLETSWNSGSPTLT